MSRAPHHELVEHSNSVPAIANIRGAALFQMRYAANPETDDVLAAVCLSLLAFDTLSFVSAFERGEES